MLPRVYLIRHGESDRSVALSVLGNEHDCAEQPVITLWNAAAHERFDAVPDPRVGGTATVKRRAIEQWENEGGEIPNISRGP